MYKAGIGVPKDLKIAIEYLMKAAELGDEDALQLAKALSSEVGKTE